MRAELAELRDVVSHLRERQQEAIREYESIVARYLAA